MAIPGHHVFMAKSRTPDEKKVLSYQKDRRNTYGEAGARSRYSIRRRKAGVNRSYRHAVREQLTLAAYGQDPGDDPADVVVRKYWKKCPDEPLRAVVRRKHTRREMNGINADPHEESQLQREAKRRQRQSGGRSMEKW
jgi:hypothetical protein